MPFPILRTPVVVLSEIFSLLEPNEVLNTSFCSKKFKRILRNHYRRWTPMMWDLRMVELEFWREVAISRSGIVERGAILAVDKSILENESKCEVIDINGFKIELSSGRLVLYFEDQILGSKWIEDYVTDLLNIDIRWLVIERNNTWAIDWINERQEKPLDRFKLCEKTNNPTNNDSNADETLDYVLRNARCTDSYIIHEAVTNNYRFNGKLGPMNGLYLSCNGYWVTCDNLMNFDAIQIYIGSSRLTVSDFNQFLRQWRAGGSQRLEYLEVCFENATVFENLFFDEDLEIVRTNEVGRYPIKNGRDVVIRDCYNIQRMDGVKALFNCDNHRCFYMIVQHGRATKELDAMDDKKKGNLHNILERLRNTQNPNNPVPPNIPEREELTVSKEEKQVEEEKNQNLENTNSRKRRAETQEDPNTPSTSAAGPSAPSGTSPPVGPKNFKTLMIKLENRIHVPDELNIAELVTNYKSWAKRNNVQSLVFFAYNVFGFGLQPPTYEEKLEQNLKQQQQKQRISLFDKNLYLRIYNFLNDPELYEAINIQNVAFNKFKARQEEISGITLEEVKRRLRKEANLEGIDCLRLVQEAKVSIRKCCTQSEFANAICGVVRHFEWHVLEKKLKNSKPLTDHEKFLISRMHNWMNEFTDDERKQILKRHFADLQKEWV